MSEANLETGKVVSREEVCPNCKGKGTSFGIKMKARLEALGMALGGLFIMIFTDDNRLMGFIALVALLSGVVKMFMANVAKCKVCEGTGKVKLETHSAE